VSVKTRTTGFYRDDAARLAAQAARIAPPDEPVLRARPASDSRTPQILLDEPSRPPLAPEPAINQNRAASRRPSPPPLPERAPVGRIVAWVLLAPFYAAFMLGSAALLVLAAKFFLKF
jgi:hypothetical protein